MSFKETTTTIVVGTPSKMTACILLVLLAGCSFTPPQDDAFCDIYFNGKCVHYGRHKHEIATREDDPQG